MLQKLRALGPGLLYAGAAIGVSHIVQSTKAGALYGSVLIIGILLAHLFKYPFFEIGPRYAGATGKSLVHGYRQIGKWTIWLTIVITFSTMFIIQAGVTVVTAGIANKIFQLPFEAWQTAAILLLLCMLILQIGKYQVLENSMKVIMIILAITTVGAVVSSFYSQPITKVEFEQSFNFLKEKDIAFLIAFIGWMPAPLDISIWHSLWTIADQKTGSSINLKKSLFDFKVGYWGTMILAICFLLLGANMIYGTGATLSNSGSIYAGQLIDTYTNTLGSWAYYIIAIAAFTTMFSTTLTCLDAMPRTMAALISNVRDEDEEKIDSSKSEKKYYQMTLFTLIVGTILVLALLMKNMGQMITVATVISFLTAPILAYLNLRAAAKLPDESKIKLGSKYLAYIGLTFLIVFSLYYLKIIMPNGQ